MGEPVMKRNLLSAVIVGAAVAALATPVCAADGSFQELSKQGERGDKDKDGGKSWASESGSRGRHHEFQGQVAPVPEPSTYALMLAGLGVLGFVARRRKGRREV
jgi:Ni/Co efflux regulator RcnB